MMPQPSPYWGDEVIWTSKNNVHNPMLDEKGRVWITSAVRRAGQPRLLQGGIEPSVGEAVPAASVRAGISPCTIRRPKQAHAHQHVLRHAPPDVRRGREQHALDERRRPGRRLAEPEDVRRDRRRGEVPGLDRARHRHQRQRQARRVRRAGPAGRSDEGQALSAAAFYAVAPAPDGVGLGHRSLGFPGAVIRLNPGANPPETALAEVFEPPFDDPKRARLLAARHGRRSQRRRLGGARERTPGELRSPQVQGPAQRPEGDRPALPRGLDALPGAAAADARA